MDSSEFRRLSPCLTTLSTTLEDNPEIVGQCVTATSNWPGFKSHLSMPVRFSEESHSHASNISLQKQQTAAHYPITFSLVWRRMVDALRLDCPLLNGKEIQRIPWERLKVFDISLEDIVAQNALVEILGSSEEMT